MEYDKLMKKVLHILLIIWGIFVSLISLILFVLEMKLLLEGGGGFGAMLLLMLFTVIIEACLGVLPLTRGIKQIKAAKAARTDLNNEQAQTIYQADIDESNSQGIDDKVQNIYETYMAANNSRILCRDEQFDNGEWSRVKIFLEGIFAGVAPVFLSICICLLISKSIGGFKPHTIQAWGGMVIILLGSVCAMLSLYFISKYNAVGNKFFYFILDKDEGLYFTHIGMGRIGNYIREHTPVGEKIKTRFSFFYTILFFLYRNPGISLIQLTKMESNLKINKKYHFAEQVLLSNDFKNYCTRIVAVEKIKYFYKGCEVWLATMEYGIKRVKKQVIYRNTTNYAMLMEKINELYTGNEVSAYDLSVSEIKQVRKNIYRRIGTFCIGVLVLLIFALISYSTYISASSNAALYEPGVIKRFESILAYRSMRRIFKIVYFVLFVEAVAFVKMIIDLLKTSKFKCLPVEVVEYIAPEHSIQNIFDDYKYFATVLYRGEPVRVGMSKTMWKQGKKEKVSLVLKKNVPYCIVDRTYTEQR